MSRFFEALERAEQERALRVVASTPPAPPSETSPTVPETVPPRPSPAAPKTTPPRAQETFFRPPRAAATAGRAERIIGVEEHLVSLLAPTSFEAEQYRALRHKIEQLHRSTDLTTIAVSSPDAGDGKTTTTLNLAGALAQAPDARILLIDADLRGANVAMYLGLDEHTAPGLVDAILNPSLTLGAVVQTHPYLNLTVITAGRQPTSPYEVLKSPRLGELLAEAREKYDYVIVDTPPLVSVPDSQVLARLVDGFVLVVGAHRTPRRLLLEALNLLEPTRVVGLVFNGDDRHLSRDSYASKRVYEMTVDGTRRHRFSSRSRGRQTSSDE